jgi:hypothetical protein
MSATAAPAADAVPEAAQPSDASPPRLEALVAATRACELQPAQYFCAWQAR